MKLIDKKVFTTPQYLTESISEQTDSSAHALILTSIISDIIKVSEFVCDKNNEVSALIDYCDVPSPVAIDSMEFVVAMYWMALLKGVQLGTQDIEIILKNLKYYVGASCDYVDITDERSVTKEACQ